MTTDFKKKVYVILLVDQSRFFHKKMIKYKHGLKSGRVERNFNISFKFITLFILIILNI